MKGSGGVLSAASIGSRGPVSVGARGSPKSFGVSLSPEAGSKGSISFNSRGLADSKPKAPISFNIPSSKPSSLVDINHGKVKSGIFDVNKPVRSSLITSHEPKLQFGLNIKNGAEKKSITARIESLKPRGMFDITRSVSKNTIVPHERKAQTAPKNGRLLNEKRPISIFGQRLQENSKSKSKELKFTPPITLNIDNGRSVQTREARVRALEPTKTLFDLSRKPAFEKALVRQAAPKIDIVKAKSPEVRAVIVKPRNEVLQAIKVKPEQENIKREQKKRAKKLKTDRPHLTHVIKTSPQISDLEKKLVHADLSMAKKVIPYEARVRGISLAEAQTLAIKRLSEKHKNKIVITPLEPVAVPSVALETQPSIKGEVGKKTQTEVLARNSVLGASEFARASNQSTDGGFKSPEQANSQFPNSPKREDPPREKEFYFEKQIDVNKKRVERAIQALDSLLKSHGTDSIPTGDGVSKLISDTDTELQSEMAKPVHKDGSLKKFKEEIGKLTRIYANEFAEKLDEIVDKYPAIKLAIEKPTFGAERRKVEHVYEGPVNGKQAFFKDYQRVNGNFQGQSEKTYFIPTSNLPGAPVV